MPNRSVVIRLLAGLMILASAALASPVAAADPAPPDSARGKVGVHELVDTDTEPAATCRYGYQVTDGGPPFYFNGLRRMRSKAPLVLARHGKRSQEVGWRMVVQAWDEADGRWVRYVRSSWQRRIATPDQAASFKAIRLTTDPWTDQWVGRFRVKLQLRWYGPDDHSIAGLATLYARFYQLIEGEPFAVDADDCRTTTG